MGGVKNKRKNGDIYTAETHIGPFFDESGEIKGFIGIEIDITERKENQEKIEQQKKSLSEVNNILEEEKAKDEAIISSIGDGVIAVNKQGKIILMNPQAEKMTGCTFYEAENLDIEEVIKIEDAARNVIKSENKPLFQVINSKEMTSQSDLYYFFEKTKRRVPISTTVAPIIIKGEVVGAIDVFKDDTKEKEIDKAKTEFVSIASHQLRTPLSTINWYTEMLLDGDVGKLNKKQKEYLGEVYRGSKRMSQLVTALLNVSRIDLGTFAIDPQPTNIVEISQEIIKELSQKIGEKKLKIKEFYDSTIPTLSLDHGLTRIIFQNLISNAVKYTEENGMVEVTIKREGNEISISVKDTGYGIPEIAKEKIFSKLYRADNVRDKEVDGNGLGLYIVKAIIEEIGGKIWFDSKENEGTTFYITFSIEGMKKKEGAKALTTKMEQKTEKTLLIVEDEVPLLTALVEKFTREGFHILQARNGEEGLESALRNHPDLILLDIIMPKMDGITMLEKLNKSTDPWGKKTEVIFLTNLSDISNIEKVSQLGANEYLIKSDWKIDDVVKKVREKLHLE